MLTPEQRREKIWDVVRVAMRSTRRELETWHGRDGVTLADERASQQGTQTSA